MKRPNTNSIGDKSGEYGGINIENLFEVMGLPIFIKKSLLVPRKSVGWNLDFVNKEITSKTTGTQKLGKDSRTTINIMYQA